MIKILKNLDKILFTFCFIMAIINLISINSNIKFLIFFCFLSLYFEILILFKEKE
jgi:hypothetical protein